MSKTQKTRRRDGDVVAISLTNGSYAYGHVLAEPLMAFYGVNTEDLLEVSEVLRAPIAFKVDVMNYAVTSGIWPVIGHSPLNGDLLEEPLFYKKDPINNTLSIYRDSTGEEWPATLADCEGLECAAVWEPEHIIDRLVDYFAGRPNKWVESMRP